MTWSDIIAKDRFADSSIRRRIWQLAGLACATIAVLGVLLAQNVERSHEANSWVGNTHAVQQMLADYKGEFVDAETGQRGYLLTRQKEYLFPYNRALAGNRALFERLKRVVVNDDESGKLQRLSEIFHDKMSELAVTIALAKSGNVAGALAIVREGRGRRDTIEFRRLSTEIADSEYALLLKRQGAAENQNRNLRFSMAIGGLLAMAIIAAAAAKTVARIDGPLRELMRGIAAISRDELDWQVPVRSNDEIGRVSRAFNDVIERRMEISDARDRAEADLAESNRQLLAEIGERTAAQGRLFRSVAELRRSNEELDNFAYSASHDLKAPLRGIRNLAEWIADDVKDTAGPDTIANLALLYTRVDRLSMLLDSLLQYARVGRVGGTLENVDTGQLVREIADYVAPRAGFTVTCRGEFPTILTHRAPLEQVLRNLIGNGLKHNDAISGAVTVSAQECGDLIELRVEDDGPGIDPVFHARIFQMFQTLKSRDEMEGSGMGLAIVKKSVEGHGGTIRVESAPPHRGTAFIFTWMNERRALVA